MFKMTKDAVRNVVDEGGKAVNEGGKALRSNFYTSKPPEDDESHQMISSLFLGPHAENYEYFKSNIITILEATRDARHNYYPEDGVSEVLAPPCSPLKMP